MKNGTWVITVIICIICNSCSLDYKISMTSSISRLIDRTGHNLEMAQYTITNNSKDILYTWVDFNSSVTDSSTFIMSRRYFYRSMGDFTFCQLLTDNVVFVDDFTSQINVSFLKEIRPGNAFSYFLASERVNDVINHIYCVSSSELKSKYGIYIVNQAVLFKPDFVVLTE